jgi:phosphoenolpyruvate carboxykinase (ATP)
MKEITSLRFELETLKLNTNNIYKNLSDKELTELAVKRSEGVISSMKALTVYTGKYTGRSPDDRFIVDDELTHNSVDWNNINHPFEEDAFFNLFSKVKEHINKLNDIFVFDGFVGADPKSRMSVRIITDTAWQSLFSRQLFIRPTKEELENIKPEFIVISLNSFKADPAIDKTRSEAFIIIDLKYKVTLIGGTAYAGEIKKSVFTAMNYYMPEKGIFPMHCSANVGNNNDTVLFFGLSGTGKTSLSADSERYLIGDDEHGWSEDGVFNFEGGCYAKCINLKKENEPQIWNAIREGAIMENVVLKENNVPDFSDGSITENTRVAYPLHYIPKAIIPSIGPHPKVIIFLTADAFGVLPPLARLTKEGAMYHFLSGYTSKLAGTERGITKPKEVFSTCFAAPFIPRSPLVYANMLGKKIEKYNTRVYLVNTGWVGGPYGIGERIKIQYTRAMVKAVITGEIEKYEFVHDEIFNLDIPTECPNVPTELLNPRNSWHEKDAYEIAAKRLAKLFIDNFKKFTNVPDEIRLSGPTNIYY